ncbi:methyl-accepting chemotaxis protein [Azospirillum sp. TSO35-2]|uniref:methyl-accepting chemotaxis protein n=1 Tax=Azospirillum sp. TSO35-2 TaxID=716796 RepID=UPI000D60627F|nr:methyl-accepting chemotaxis protein [Azospirillum sp. TSO35-2]PWC35792.1 hypothetical protein TSO352_11195 [Azospirillum sp. TSO35-2]
MKIGVRLALAFGVTVLLAVAMTTLSNLWLSNRLVDQAADRQLQTLQQFLATRLSSEAQRALTLAEGLAGNVEIQDAFAAGDRDRLARMLVPGFKALKERQGLTQMQFHTPDSRSFLRVHRPEKFGDDLSAIRFTVVEVNKTHQPVAGLENGVEGLGIRGVVPVLRNGVALGSFEVGLSFGKPFFESFKASTGADVAFYVRKGEGFEVFASTFAESLPFSVAEQTAALAAPSAARTMVLSGRGSAVVLMPVRDYRGTAFGVTALALDRSAFDAAIDEAHVLALAIGVLALVLGLAIAWRLERAIARPIQAMTGSMAELAGGNTDVRIAGTGRGDEIGAMAGALEVFRRGMIEAERLRAGQDRMKRAADEERRTAMQALADRFEADVGRLIGSLSSAATEMEATAGSMSATAEHTNRQSAVVATASQQATGNVQTVAAATEQLAASINAIGDQATRSRDVSGKAVVDARQTDAAVRQLADSAGRIGQVVTLIQDIASQTNLLALNATIEAARAGEAGKGFAVVAGEVKTLANQTARATDDIRRQIEQMQQASSGAVAAIEDIGVVIGQVSGIADDIAAAVEQQGEATREIARNVQQAAVGTREVTVNIAGVQQAAGETGAAATQVLGAARDLSRQAEALTTEVRSFLAGVRAA